KIEEVIKEEEDKESILAKKTKLNENVCVRCCQTFGIIFNRRQICQQCKLYVCKRCCQIDVENKGYVCNACIKERELRLKSCEWFYNNVSKKFKRFGSAKVVRTLYKQKSNKHRQYHTDNESDSGYDPSLVSSLKSPSIFSRRNYQSEGEEDRVDFESTVMIRSRKEGRGYSSWYIGIDSDLDPIGPAPILSLDSGISRTSSVETLTNDNKQNNNNLNNNNGQQKEDNDNKALDKQDIYKEAFEHYKQTEERKFQSKFDNLLKQLYTSLEEPVQNGGEGHFGSTSYGQVIDKYRNQLRELLVGVSQRLEMAVESFDNSPAQSFNDTSQKVRKIVSKLVEESFGESIDVISDEAVSDLSSLSDDSGDHQVKSFEEQIAQAVLSKVLENFRRESNIDIPLDLLDGNFSEKPHDSHMTDFDKSHDLHSKGTSSDDENSVISKHSYGCQVEEERLPVRDFGIQSENVDVNTSENQVLDGKVSHDFGVQSEFSDSRAQILRDSSVQSDLVRPRTEDFGVQSQISPHSDTGAHRPNSESCAVQSDFSEPLISASQLSNREACSSASIHRNSDNINDRLSANEEVVEPISVKKSHSSNSSAIDVQPDSVLDGDSNTAKSDNNERTRESDLAELKQFSQRFASPRPVRKHEIEEVLDEEPIQKVTVNREESDFASRVSTYDRLHNSHIPLPDFNDDYEDNEFFQNEIDPDLLSMNLAPILEEEEDNYIEEEDEEENDGEENSPYGQHWKDNWIFGGSKLSPYSNLGKKFGGGGFDQVYLTIPQPEEELTPKIGNRDADLMSDTISDGLDDRDADILSDEESSFFSRNMDEITRITSRKGTSSATSSVPAVSSGIQTDSELDTSFETSVSMRSLTSKKSEPNYMEEIIPAEGDDPKFEIPPESVSVPEGDVTKFSCRVRGTEPIDVKWYKITDGELEELDDSEYYELSHDLNRHTLTVFNPCQMIAGQYMCMAINEKGHSSSYIILTVKKNNQDFKKPEFLKEIQDIEVKEGQNVKFRAKVKGYPSPRVVWYKDGKFIKHGGDYKIEKFGNRDYILTIDHATPEDDAEYWVVARNVAGDVKSTAQLIVESKELDLSPKVTEVKRAALPTKNKDDQQLSNMGKKLFMTRERMEAETEDMINSANKLNHLHKSLDEFDSILNSFEKEIHVTNSPSDWDSDSLLSHNLHQNVQQFTHMKNAAESIRNTTSSALAILKSTEKLLQSESINDDDTIAATSTPRLEDSPPSNSFTEGVSDNNRLTLKEERSVSDVVPKLDLSVRNEEEMVHRPLEKSSAENIVHSVPEKNIDPIGAESNSIADNDKTSEIPAEFERTRNIDDDSETLSVINFGAKEVDISKYPDYYVGEHPSSPRRKWEVNMESYSPRAEVVNRDKLQHAEEQIYVTAGRIYGLESHIHNLHNAVTTTPNSPKYLLSSLEDEVALTAAKVEINEKRVQQVEKIVDSFHQPPSITTTTPSCDETSSLSPSLSIDSGFSSIRDRPPPTVLCGETLEDDLPESQTEINEEVGVELPSVNRLKALFSHAKEDDSSLRRVHSITARNVSKEKLEQLRKLESKTEDRSPDAGKSTLSVKLTHAETRVRQIEAEPTQVFPETKGELYPSSATPSKPARTGMQRQSLSVTTSSKARAAPQPPSPLTKSQHTPQTGALSSGGISRTPQHQNSGASQKSIPQTPKTGAPSSAGTSITPITCTTSPYPPKLGAPKSGETTKTTPLQSSSKGRAPQPPQSPSVNTTVTPNRQTTSVSTPQGASASTPSSGKGKARIRSGCINARASFWEKRIQGEETKEEEFPDMIEHVDD
ncbi:hypothetical protein FSP39_004717, partial [Pinctada imbricata]